MPQVTKRLNGEIKGISISLDGARVSTNVMWTSGDVAATPAPGARPMPTRPFGISQVSIVADKVTVDRAVIGDAPASVATNATALAVAVKALVESLISTGKITP